MFHSQDCELNRFNTDKSRLYFIHHRPFFWEQDSITTVVNKLAI